MNKEVPQRLQKLLAERGVGSRREIESWIVAGEIHVNNKLAVLGTKVLNSDKITLRGKLISAPHPSDNKPRIIMYHKPTGEICTRSDPQGRNTVFSSLPRLQGQRWINVGRLDINSSGLLLFTTDGELANKLMHPSANIEREYAVRLLGKVSKEIERNVINGVTLEDGTQAKFLSAKFVGGSGANSWYHVTLTQGRYREVRRIWESQGLRVSRLIRVRYGSLNLPRNLAEGKFMDIAYEQIRDMLK